MKGCTAATINPTSSPEEKQNDDVKIAFLVVSLCW